MGCFFLKHGVQWTHRIIFHAMSASLAWIIAYIKQTAEKLFKTVVLTKFTSLRAFVPMPFPDLGQIWHANSCGSSVYSSMPNLSEIGTHYCICITTHNQASWVAEQLTHFEFCVLRTVTKRHKKTITCIQSKQIRKLQGAAIKRPHCGDCYNSTFLGEFIYFLHQWKQKWTL